MYWETIYDSADFLINGFAADKISTHFLNFCQRLFIVGFVDVRHVDTGLYAALHNLLGGHAIAFYVSVYWLLFTLL